MLEKPDFPDELLTRALARHYAIRVTALTFLPLGNDAACSVYRADAYDGRAYLLKIKRGRLYEPSLTVPCFLVDRGIDAVVAPLPTRSHTLWTPLGDFALIVYPFIEGPRAWTQICQRSNGAPWVRSCVKCTHSDRQRRTFGVSPFARRGPNR